MSNVEEKFQLFLRETHSSAPSQNESLDAANKPLLKPETKVESRKTFWWLKGGEKNDNKDVFANDADSKQVTVSTQSSVSSSMAEFLQREGICTAAITARTGISNEGNVEMFPSVQTESSATKADYSDDFTDDDISSIMDQLSQLAGSGGDDSGRSVGDILKEAEEVVRISNKNQYGSKGLMEHTPPPPLMKPESHLTINLTEKIDTEESEIREGVYIPEEKKASNAAGANKSLELMKMPYERHIASHADEIFKQIEVEVKNKIAASKGKQPVLKSNIQSKHQPNTAGTSHIDLNFELKKSSNSYENLPTIFNSESVVSEDVVKIPEKPKSSFSPLRGEPLSIVIEESASDASLEADPAVENWKHAQDYLPIKSSQGKKTKDINSQFLEDELSKEKQANQMLKAEMNSQVEDLRKQIELVKCKSLEKRFSLEKDVSILKATLAGYEKKAAPHIEMGGGDYTRSNLPSSHRLKLLEEEMQKQEQLIVVYQNENVKLCQDVKQLKQELKAKESLLDGNLPLSARRITVAEASEKEIFLEKLKGKDVLVSQLNATIEALKSENKKCEESVNNLKLTNAQIKDEVEKYKKLSKELKSKDTSQLVASLQKELETQKSESAKKETEIDMLHRDLRRTLDELESRKLAVKATNLESKNKTDTLNERLRELQMELDEERAFSEEEKRKHCKDGQKIQELSMQVQDMEMLLKKNRPALTAAVILSAKSDGDLNKNADTPRVRFLEDRIHQLEEELDSAKNVLDSGFEGIQVQYKSLKDKYDLNIEQLTNDLAAWKKEAAAWKEAAKQNNLEVDFNKQLKEYAVSQRVAKPHLFANAIAVKEDAHLIATIRGLKNELLAKDRSIRTLDKKLTDSLKTNKRLQTEREKVLAQPTLTKAPTKGTKKVEEPKDIQIQLLPFLERQKELEHAISQLKDKNRIKDDQIELFTIELREASERRLRDLEELQEEHDEEIARLLSENFSKHFHNRYSELEGKVHNQEQVIVRLQDQLKMLDEHRAEILVLKVEREHLEKNLKDANKKLSLLRQSQSPDQKHYEALVDKIADLELRHESREQNLQAVVRDLLRHKSDQDLLRHKSDQDLLRHKSDQGDSSTLREQLSQKNRELCYYKSEMNKIIGKVVYLENELAGRAPKRK